MLFEKFLFSLITTHFGKFIKCFDKKFTHANIFKGSMQLHNLELAPDAFSDYSSVKLLRSTISSLTIKVPWSFLYSKKCKIQVDRISIALSTKLDDVDEEKSLREKLELLKLLTKSCNFIKGNDASGKEKAHIPGFFQRLRNRILDNIHIEVNELSICFVGSTGNPDDRNIGASLKVSSIKCKPTSSNNAPSHLGEACRKNFRCIVIENATLHINERNPFDAFLGSDQHTFDELDFEDFTRACEDVSNSRTVLSSKRAIVSIEFDFENDEFQCSTVIESGLLFIDQNILAVSLSLFNLLNKARRPPAIGRPVSRPTSANASAWWQYAIFSVVSEMSTRSKRHCFDWDKYILWKQACAKYYNLMLVEYGAPWIVPGDINVDDSEPERILSLDNLIRIREKAHDAVKTFKEHHVVSDFRLCHESVVHKPKILQRNAFFPRLLTFGLPQIQIHIDDDLFLDIETFSVEVYVEPKKFSVCASLQSVQLSILETRLFQRGCQLFVGRSNELTLKCDIYRLGECAEIALRVPSVKIYISESSINALREKYEKYHHTNMMLLQKLDGARNIDANGGKPYILPSFAHKINVIINSAIVTIEHVTVSVEEVCALFNSDSVTCSMFSALVKILGINLFRGKNIVLTPQIVDCVFNMHAEALTIENNLVAFEHIKNTMPALKQFFNGISQGDSEKASGVHDSKIFLVTIELASVRFSELEFYNVTTSTAICDGWRVSVDCNGVKCASECYPNAKISFLMWADAMLSSSPYAGIVNENGIGFHFYASDLHLQVNNVFAEVIESLYDFVNVMINPQEDAHVYLKDTKMIHKPIISGSIFVGDCSVCLIDDENMLLPVEICALGRQSLVVKCDYFKDKSLDAQVDFGDRVNAFIKGSSPTVVDLLPHCNGSHCSVRFHLTPPQSRDLLLFPYAKLHLDLEADMCDAVMHFPTIQALWLQFSLDRLPLWRLRKIGSRIHFTNRQHRKGLPLVRSPTSQGYAELGYAAQLKSAYCSEVVSPSPCYSTGIFPMEITMNMKFTQSGLYYLWGNGEIASMYSRISSCEIHLSNRDGCLRTEVAGQLSFPELRFISRTSFVAPVSQGASPHVDTSRVHSHYTPFSSSHSEYPLHLKLVYTNDSRPPFNAGVANESLNVSITGCVSCKPSAKTLRSPLQYEPILLRFSAEEVAAWLTAFSYRTNTEAAARSMWGLPPGLSSFAPPCTKFVSEEVDRIVGSNSRRISTTVQFAPTLLYSPAIGLAVSLGGGLHFSSTSVLSELCISSASLLYSDLFFYDVDHALAKRIIFSAPRSHGQYSGEKNTKIFLLGCIESFSGRVKDTLRTQTTHQMSTLAVYWTTSQKFIKPHDGKACGPNKTQRDGLNLCFASRRLLVGPVVSNTDEALLASLKGSAVRLANGFCQIRQTVVRCNDRISLAERARIDLYTCLSCRGHDLLDFLHEERLGQPQLHCGAVKSADAVESEPLVKALQEPVVVPPTFHLFVEAIHMEYNWHTQLLAPPAPTASVVFQCGPLQCCNKHRKSSTSDADSMKQTDKTCSVGAPQPAISSFLFITLVHAHVFAKLNLGKMAANADAGGVSGSLKAGVKIFPLVFPFGVSTIQSHGIDAVPYLGAQEELFDASTAFPNSDAPADLDDGVCRASKAVAPLALSLSSLLFLILPTSYMLLYELMQSLAGVRLVVPTESCLHPACGQDATLHQTEVEKTAKEQSMVSSSSGTDYSLKKKNEEHPGLCFTISCPLLELRILKLRAEEAEWNFLQNLKSEQVPFRAALSATVATSLDDVDYCEDEEGFLCKSEVAEEYRHNTGMVHKEVFSVAQENGAAAQSLLVTAPLESSRTPSSTSDDGSTCSGTVGKSTLANNESASEQKKNSFSQWAYVCTAHEVFVCDCFVLRMDHIRFASDTVHKWSMGLAHATCKHCAYCHPNHPLQKWQPHPAQIHRHVSLIRIDGLMSHSPPTSLDPVNHIAGKKHLGYERVEKSEQNPQLSNPGQVSGTFSVEKENSRCEIARIEVGVEISSIVALAEFLIESPLKRVSFLGCRADPNSEQVPLDEIKGEDAGMTTSASPPRTHIIPITGDVWSLTEDVHLSHRQRGKVLYFRSLSSNHLTVQMNGHTIFIEPSDGRLDSIPKGNAWYDNNSSKPEGNALHRAFRLDHALLIVEAGLTVRFVGAGGFRIPIRHWGRGLATKMEQIGTVAALLPYTTLGEASWVECEGEMRLGFTEDCPDMNTSREEIHDARSELNSRIETQLPKACGRVARGHQCTRGRQEQLGPYVASSSSLSAEVGSRARETNKKCLWSSLAEGCEVRLKTSCSVMHDRQTSLPLGEENRHAVPFDDEGEELVNPVNPVNSRATASLIEYETINLFQLFSTSTLAQSYGAPRRSIPCGLIGFIKYLTVRCRSPVEPRFLHLDASLELQTHFSGGPWSEGQLRLQRLTMHSQLEGVHSSTTSTTILAPTSVDVRSSGGLHHAISLGPLSVDMTKNDVVLLRSLIQDAQSAVEYFVYLHVSKEEKELLQLIDSTVAWRPIHTYHDHDEMNESEAEEIISGHNSMSEPPKNERAPSGDATLPCETLLTQRERTTKSGKTHNIKESQHRNGVELTSFALYIPLITVTLGDHRFPLLRVTVRDIVLRHTANAAFERAIFLQSQSFEVDVFGKGLWDSVLLPTAELIVECTQTKSRYSSNTHLSVACDGLQMQCSYRVLSNLLYATNQVSAFFQQPTCVMPAVLASTTLRERYSSTAVLSGVAHDSTDAAPWGVSPVQTGPSRLEAYSTRTLAAVRETQSFDCSSPLSLIELVSNSTPLSPEPVSMYGELTTRRPTPTGRAHAEQGPRNMSQGPDGFVEHKTHPNQLAVLFEGSATHRFKNNFNCAFYLRIRCIHGGVEEDWLCVSPSSFVDVLIPHKRAHELFVCVLPQDYVEWSNARASYVLTEKGQNSTLSKAEVAVSALRYGKATGLLVGEDILVVLSCVDPRRLGTFSGNGTGIAPDGFLSEMLPMNVTCEASRWAGLQQSVLPASQGGGNAGEAAPILSSDEEGDVGGLIVVQIHAKLTLCNESGVPLLVNPHLVDERVEEAEIVYGAVQRRSGEVGGRQGPQTRRIINAAVYELLPTGYCYPLKSNCFTLCLRCNTDRTFNSVYETEIDVLALKSGMLLRLYPLTGTTDSNIHNADDKRDGIRWGSCEVAQTIRQDAINDARPLTFLVMCKEITESQSRIITLLPCLRVLNHTGVALKLSIWQKDGFAGSQTLGDCALMEPWLPRENSRKWCVSGKEQNFFYNSLVPLAIHDNLRHNHALSILQYTIDSNLALGLSLTQCTGTTVRTKGLIPIVNNLRDAVHHSSSWLPLQDSTGCTFFVQVSISQRVIVLSVALWVYNLTYYPLLMTDSALTHRLTAGQDVNTGIIPSQGTPFLIGCKLQDFTYMCFKIGLDGEWSSLVSMDVGSSGVFESIQKGFRITRSCNYTIQFPNLQMGRPIVLCITPRWVFINDTAKPLRLFFNYPGMQDTIKKACEAAQKAASQTRDNITSRDITLTLASAISIELKPGDYHVSCIGTDAGNKLALKEKVEAVPSSLTTSCVAKAGEKDGSVFYEGQRTDYVPIDQPGQATLNLWAVPRRTGGLDAVDDASTFVTGRIAVSVRSAEGTLAVVLSSYNDHHVLIQNRTQATTVVVTQKGRQRRSLIPIRQDRFFFWEDSGGEHVIRVHAQGYTASWFEIDFTHGNCIITPRQGDPSLKKEEQSSYERGKKKDGKGKCSSQPPTRGVSKTSPFHVRGYVSAEKKRVTVIITVEPIPKYVAIDPWRTSIFLGLKVPFMQARWLRDGIQAEEVAHGTQQPVALVSCAVEGFMLDWLDTGDSSSGFVAIHQLQLIDEMHQAVFVYRARVKSPQSLRRSAGSSPRQPVVEDGPVVSAAFGAHEPQWGSLTSLPQLPHDTPSTPRRTPTESPSPWAVPIPELSPHALSSFHRIGSWFGEDSQPSFPSETTSPLSFLEACGSGSLPPTACPHNSPRGAGLGLRAHPGRQGPAATSGWVAGSVFSLVGYKAGDWVHDTMELEWDLKLELSVVKHPDGMRRVTDLHGGITALVVVISDLWLAHFIREVWMLRSLLARARHQRRRKDRQLTSLHFGGIVRVTSSGTEEALIENTEQCPSRSAWSHGVRSESSMGRLAGPSSAATASLSSVHRRIPSARLSEQVGCCNETQRELMDTRGRPVTTYREGTPSVHLASQLGPLLPRHGGNTVLPTELVPQSVFVVRLVHTILAQQQQQSTETSAGANAHSNSKRRHAGTAPHGRDGNFQLPTGTSSLGLFYVEKMHLSRVTFFITFTRQDPDPLWPLIGAYTLMLPNQLRQCEFYFKPFKLERFVGTISSIEAILRKWCVHSLARQWTKVTKLGTVFNMLQWWRKKCMLRGPPVKLNMSLVRRLRRAPRKHPEGATATRAANACYPFMVPFMPSEEEDAEEANSMEMLVPADLEFQR